MKLRELPDVLHGRPCKRDALGGVEAESAEFFSSSDFRRGYRALVWPLTELGRNDKGSKEGLETTTGWLSPAVLCPPPSIGRRGKSYLQGQFLIKAHWLI